MSRTTTEFRQALLAVKAYPDRRRAAKLKQRQREELEAVERVMEATRLMSDGATRLNVIELRFFKKSHNLAGAAMCSNCSQEKARDISGDFIRAVAHELKYL